MANVRSKRHDPLIGTCYLHTVIATTPVYVEAHDDETKETATEVLRNAVHTARTAASPCQVYSPTTAAATSPVSDATPALSSESRRRGPGPTGHKPNGKIERFHRTLAEGWAFKTFYSSESARLAALPAWIHLYNHHRPLSAIGKAAPIARLDNLAGRHTW